MQNSVARRRPFSLPSVRLGLEVLAFGVLVVLGMALVLAQTGQVASTGYQVERLEERKVYWQRENQGMEAEVARLRSLDRIEQEARNRLHMVTPSSYMYVTVNTLPEQPTPLLKRALGERETTPADTSPSWWDRLGATLMRWGTSS